MSMQAIIQEKVENLFEPQHFSVVNESHLHSGPATESHFKLTIVSTCFLDLSPVKRHQEVYQLLSQQLSEGIHALSLHLYSPEEWLARSAVSPESPNCRGGGKNQ
ncbi:MAG: BolA family transcriptional regulator [Gammaproteobacteria bacterium]|nr:BolA family transcriptional regulator [Gammaproteobacteria bacterium]